jgi:hypothetical protein
VEFEASAVLHVNDLAVDHDVVAADSRLLDRLLDEDSALDLDRSVDGDRRELTLR